MQIVTHPQTTRKISYTNTKFWVCPPPKKFITLRAGLQDRSHVGATRLLSHNLTTLSPCRKKQPACVRP